MLASTTPPFDHDVLVGFADGAERQLAIVIGTRPASLFVLNLGE
jgi:hypothetical protein